MVICTGMGVCLLVPHNGIALADGIKDYRTGWIEHFYVQYRLNTIAVLVVDIPKWNCVIVISRSVYRLSVPCKAISAA